MTQTIEELLTADVAIEVASHEAIIRSAYKDSKGIWTWSVGLTNNSGHNVERYKDNPQTLEYSLAVYIWALRRYAQEVLDAFDGYPLTQAQFAAALSFHYNTGAIDRATWVKTVKAGGSRDAAYQQFMSWNKPSEIVGRRTKEAELFFNGKWSNDGRMTEYTRLTKSYTPVWGSAKRIDVSYTLSKLLAPAQSPVIEAVVSEPDRTVVVTEHPVEEPVDREYSEPSETQTGDKPMEKTMGVVRHVITAVGGILVALGVTDQTDVANLSGSIETIVGAVMVVGATVASIYAKVRGPGGLFGPKL